MNIRLLLVRHGETAWNVEGRFMGQRDIPLDAMGRRQVDALAKRLADERPALIYASDLSRARDTALAIQSSLAARVDIRFDVRLREMRFGDWEGFTFDELKARDPQAVELWEKDWVHVTPPNGEALPAFSERVAAIYQELYTTYADQTVTVVGHGGSLQLLIAHSLGVPPEKFWQFRLSNASLSEINLHPAGAILNLLNDTCHLENMQ